MTKMEKEFQIPIMRNEKKASQHWNAFFLFSSFFRKSGADSNVLRLFGYSSFHRFFLGVNNIPVHTLRLDVVVYGLLKTKIHLYKFD